MPAGAVEGRSEQLAMVAGLLHERGTDPRIGELLDQLEGSSLLADPESPPAVNVRELRRDYDRYVRLPASWCRTSPAPPRWPSAPGRRPVTRRTSVAFAPTSRRSSSSSGAEAELRRAMTASRTTR